MSNQARVLTKEELIDSYQSQLDEESLKGNLERVRFLNMIIEEVLETY